MPKKILIVDDEPEVLKLMELRLRTNGFQTRNAQDGQEALEAIYQERPDLIILDLVLPKIDGSAVCNQLKRDKKYCKVPIVMLTAKDQDADIKLGELEGADAYITKPFDPEALVSKIKELLEKADSGGNSRIPGR